MKPDRKKETVAQNSIREQVRLIANELDYMLMRMESTAVDPTMVSGLITQQDKLNEILDRLIASNRA